MNDKFLTVKNIAEYLGVNDSLIYDLIKKGELTSVRLGKKILVKESDLLYFISKNTNTKIDSNNNVHATEKEEIVVKAKRNVHLNVEITAAHKKKLENYKNEKKMSYADVL